MNNPLQETIWSLYPFQFSVTFPQNQQKFVVIRQEEFDKQ